jgi:hypothetical protein
LPAAMPGLLVAESLEVTESTSAFWSSCTGLTILALAPRVMTLVDILASLRGCFATKVKPAFFKSKPAFYGATFYGASTNSESDTGNKTDDVYSRPEPATAKIALSGRDAAPWGEALAAEWDMLWSRGTFVEDPLRMRCEPLSVSRRETSTSSISSTPHRRGLPLPVLQRANAGRFLPSLLGSWLLGWGCWNYHKLLSSLRPTSSPTVRA